MKNLSLLLFSLLIYTQGQAQFSAGLKTGIIFSSVELNGLSASLDPFAGPVTTGMIGAFGQYEASDRISLRLGANYVHRGFSLSETGHVSILDFPVPIGLKTKFSTKYIDIPATVHFNHQIGKVRTYAFGGGGISRALSAEIQPQVTALIDFNLPDISVPTNSYNRTEFFGLAGLGAALPIGRGHVFGEVQYQHSFESLKPDFLIDIDVKNKGFSVGIGYAMSF